MVGTSGRKFAAIRDHLQKGIAEQYRDMDVTCDTFPADGIDRDPQAYKAAIDALKPGSGCCIFTPDDTHFDIAMYAVERKCHVLVTKPAVMTVDEHIKLRDAARKYRVLVQIELHKRWDQIYADARERIRSYGDFTYFNSYMSQPQSQLQTFKAWAGKSSDISYYLNSHHMDIHCWAMQGRAVPVKVTAFGSTGVASGKYGCPPNTEDVITVLSEWKNIPSGNKGIAVYTAAWTAPDNAEVHSQQRFQCLCHNGEVRADQAHRGYEVTADRKYMSVNPMYMKYTRDSAGYYAGQRGYGYLSIETWVNACRDLNHGKKTLEECHATLPTLETTLELTALLEAGRRSLDDNGASIDVQKLIKGEER
ncbi:unnamed protein product [Vitrella brassicaformis CCMP3155]|uniref:Gfo/Idh/MocA-like oxidoreductase N-terminal domain-containing protein n=1 Tax=Vitrella brassicaformis (strain CCMP3155) TaxID=1169540 RepID=A0A0G4FG55_VITBC|nr:unnamed protein product [Vitrella brassicaformis CCMP3155]|eukprot:CEM12189.1 unnamed protein product [Vitrella brassicaformis CCMP3155]